MPKFFQVIFFKVANVQLSEVVLNCFRLRACLNYLMEFCEDDFAD